MGKRLLLVDDSKDVRESMRLILELEGFEIAEAENGHEALEVARLFQPDLIFLDMWMPVMSGPEFCAKRRNYPDIREIPVVAFSADKTAADQLKTLHAQAFLPKPVEPDQLVELAKTLAEA